MQNQVGPKWAAVLKNSPAVVTPSSYQQAIIDWVSNPQGSRHAMVIARAGSGKTKTLEMVANEIGEYGLGTITTLAFNKVIAEELSRRLGANAGASTLNSKGNQILSKFLKSRSVFPKLDKWKYQNFFKSYYENMVDTRYLRDVQATAVNLLGKAMAELSDDTAKSLDLVVAHYGIDIPNGIQVQELYAGVAAAMTYGQKSALQGVVAFDDQIWLPSKWNLTQYAFKSDWVLVDEAQDLSRAKLKLAMMCCDLDGMGRMMMVGDDKQAIYGFSGASADSIENIISALDAKIFTLPVSYRCSAAVIRHAQKIVPDILPRDDAPEGEVRTIAESALSADLTPGSLVLCRLTAPLVGLCISLLSQRVPAKVRGRDIARQLVKFASDALGGASFSMFGPMLAQAVTQKIVAIAALSNSESKVEDLLDRRDAILAIVEGYNVTSMLELEEAVGQLFSDEDATITLSTIHRAKGEEAENVYIIRPDKLPLVWENQQEWEAKQEAHLLYVAITRAITTLTYVSPSVKKGSHTNG